MESNSVILGRIDNGGALSKTYLESKFRVISEEFLAEIFSSSNTNKLYLKNNIIYSENEKNKTEDMKEIEIINILPYYKHSDIPGSNFFYPRFIIEFIEKSVLLSHLREEKNMLEEQVRERTL